VRAVPDTVRPVRVDRDGYAMPEEAQALDELVFSLYLNGRHLMAAMTAPDRLSALAVGLLLVEQAIRSRDEIESIREDGPCVRVLTTDPFRVVVPRRGVITGCGGAVSEISERRLPPLPSAAPLPVEDVMAALGTIAAPPEGLFSAALRAADGWSVRSDDLGLTTALARAIGVASLGGVSRDRLIGVVSHRVTAELVRAAVVAGVPVLASTGLPTRLAIELAERTGLALCGRGGPGGFVCYTHAERLRLRSSGLSDPGTI